MGLQDVVGFTQTVMSAKEGAIKKDQSFLIGWPKARADKPPTTGKPKAGPAAKSGKSAAAVCWLCKRGECKWGASCKYRQVCSNCEGGHPASDCSKGKQAGDRKQFPTKPRY